MEKKITANQLSALVHSFVAAVQRQLPCLGQTMFRDAKRAPEAPVRQSSKTSSLVRQNTNSFAFAKPGSGFTDALKNTFLEKASRSRTMTVARAAFP